LSAWLEIELAENESYNRIASRIQIASSSEINDETIRRWHKKIYTRRLGDEMLAKIAAYRRWPIEQVRGWLNGTIEFEDLAGTTPKSEKLGEGNAPTYDEILTWISNCEDPEKLTSIAVRSIGQATAIVRKKL
jgi:hypothetical protein